MRFQYDEQKDQKNLAGHDVDFETAALVFDDPYAVTIRDTAHDEKEIGTSPLGRLAPARFFLSFTRGLPTRRVRKSFG